MPAVRSAPIHDPTLPRRHPHAVDGARPAPQAVGQPGSATAGQARPRVVTVWGPALIVGLLIVSVLLVAWRQAEAHRWVTHTRDVLQASQALLSHAKDAETGQRGYLLTGDAAYLAPYLLATRTVGADLQRLRALTRDDPAQRQRLDGVAPLLQAKLAELDATVRLRGQGDAAGALAIVRSHRGKALMDDLRAQLAQVDAHELRLLERRERHEARDGWALVATLLLGGLAAAALTARTVRFLARSAERAAEQARSLAASERRFRGIFDSTVQFIGLLAPDGTVLQTNRASLEAVAGTEAQLIGRPFWETPWWAGCPRLRERIRHAVRRAAAGEHVRFETRYCRADGAHATVDFSLRPVRNERGEVVLLVPESHDITAHERTQRALQDALAGAERARRELGFQKMALDEAAIVAVTDVTGRITDVNDKFCAISGYGRSELLGQTHRVLNSGHHPAGFFQRMYGEIARGRPWRGEICNRAKDGRLYWVDTMIVPSVGPDGKPERYVAIRQDITERKRVEQALLEADARKNEFLATLAHELRNPLAPVLNAARLLERRETLSAHGRQAVAMIERQTRHMKRLVDDLLEINRISRGTIELRREPMRLDEAVRQAVDALGPAFEAKRQRLGVLLPDEPLALVADPVRIHQILENLLTNACKYTPTGGNVRIEAWGDGASVQVRVVDDGIGIEPGTIERLFGLFVQAEPGVGEHQGGLGIGLAMVRRLAELHGGSAHAESAGRGLGSTFSVRLPRAPQAPA